VFFPKNTPNWPFLAQEALLKFFHFFVLLTVRSCPRLLQEHVQKVDRTDCEIISFEVQRKVVPGRDSRL
jgi:hypothetical protein